MPFERVMETIVVIDNRDEVVWPIVIHDNNIVDCNLKEIRRS
jgi:hypothetical protein